MDDWRDVILQGRDEPRGKRPRLMGAGDRKNHPPVAAQKIRSPRAAAFRFQQFFPRSAEFPEAGITGNDNPVFGPAGWRGLRETTSRTNRRQAFSSAICLRRVKARVIQKLPGRAGQDETAVGIIRPGFARKEIHFARGCVGSVFPNQFIGESKGVEREIQTGAGRFPVSMQIQLGNKLGLRYQTDNALRTLAGNCPANGGTKRRCAIRPPAEAGHLKNFTSPVKVEKAAAWPHSLPARAFAGIYPPTAGRLA